MEYEEKYLELVIVPNTTILPQCTKHMHLTEDQCNLLVYGYIRSIENIFDNLYIGDDIYNECWNLLVRSYGIRKTIYDLGVFYQGYECQIDSLNLKSMDSKASVQMHFVHKKQQMQKEQETIDWVVTSKQKAEYDTVFHTLNHTNGKAAGHDIITPMLESRLDRTTLSKIWELSDIDRDGRMDDQEFALCMHLIHMVKSGKEVPVSLQNNFIPPNKRNMLNIRWVWITFDGKDKEYTYQQDGRLYENGSFRQQTYVTHPWKIYNYGYFAGLYLPTSSNATHLIELSNDTTKFNGLHVSIVGLSDLE
eukprot:272869_1